MLFSFSHAPKPKGHQLRSLKCESLEPRVVLDGTASGAAALPWFDPGVLTYSFVPDGTGLAGYESTLFADLEATGTEAEWQGEFARAFDAWLSSLAVSASEVEDSGDPFGTFGPSQGDSRFGDIRIGAVPLSQNTMAEAVPHSVITQGSWAGDILLNANAPWSDLQQVYAVALHEVGHVLGLGHSDDPASPMYFHGVHDAPGPTANDLALLDQVYHGVDIEAGDDDHGDDDSDLGDEYRDEPEFSFDPATAISLTASVGSTARYHASGALTVDNTSVLYKLESLGEIDHFENLNIAIRATEWNGLISDVKLFDESGDPVRTTTLRNGAGVLVVQADDVEPNKFYFLAVTTIATSASNQIGGFELFAEYSIPRLVPTEFVSFEITGTHPVMEQSIELTSSRLLHLMVGPDLTVSGIDSGDSDDNSVTAVWGTLVDSDGNILSQLAMHPGEARSAPIVFLEAGEYRLIVETGTPDGSTPDSVALSIYIDDISIDVGPGVVDPAIEPLQSCDAIGADPNNCSAHSPVIPVNGPVFPDPAQLPPAPQYPSIPPWTNPPWYYWPAVGGDTILLHNYRNAMDVSGDNFVTPLDVLLVISELNSATASDAQLFVDTSADGVVSPVDALLVINFLNSRTASGEGEIAPIARGNEWVQSWAFDFTHLTKPKR